ncbi:MAG TPA: hypothetical protein VMU81_03350 [Acetobacteraceae bacterium]|nr:hypothetical protein [Acetobacteraceae bacterium]
MKRTKVAIACQGGGSQTAFTAGALKALLESRAREEFMVAGISGGEQQCENKKTNYPDARPSSPTRRGWPTCWRTA